MNLQQLEYIIALDDHKNFSKAAESCFITQATLSTMIKKLEEELNLTIFDRKTNPIITTDCGKEIISEARKIIMHKKLIIDMAQSKNERISGKIKIGVIPTISGNLLHRILPNILSKYKGLEIDIQELTTQNIIDKLKTNEIDLGIASTPLNHKEIEEDILYYEKFLIYGQLTSKKKTYSPNNINPEDLWLLETGNCITDQINDICSLKENLNYNNLKFRPQSFESLLNMVDEFHGITLIPELYFLDMSSTRKKNIMEFSKPFPVREVSLIFYRPYSKSRIIQTIAEEIKNVIIPLLSTSHCEKKDLKIAKL